MMRFGLIGKHLAHSFSKRYFDKKFETEQLKDNYYQLFELPAIDNFTELIHSEKNLIGLNVTIPYKKSIIPYLDEIDDTAEAIQSVNTILFKNGKSKGFNTDIIGFEHSIIGWLNDINCLKALIFGNGGAAQAIKYVLKNLSVDYKVVSRSPSRHQLSYKMANEYIDSHHLLINTTPLGMFPHLNNCPNINYDLITSKHFCYDLIYNPDETLFLSKSKFSGAQIKNGIEMLTIQAEASWEIWKSSIND